VSKRDKLCTPPEDQQLNLPRRTPLDRGSLSVRLFANSRLTSELGSFLEQGLLAECADCMHANQLAIEFRSTINVGLNVSISLTSHRILAPLVYPNLDSTLNML
jgi:hypothetical protein